ncbi:glycosyltransferase family 2 protein [Horticoccus luteus]|uniref:Glycosyltransferase family 2 protein n=1 Tax=Horticoccus luteus TaxID=2862869 RepID=A0A8F9XF91_9BACT|nr:glycosyltransferase family 2 protein [Horticoccus luteus]QYM77842.1 glycosyltransferase family 2 protein [Horticoccus luteus]
MVPTPATQLPVSVVIVARNEAHNLPRCLASVQGWTAETVLVLNNTTDASAAVAEPFGAQVHDLPWQGFRDTKNAANALAAHPWILSLDADEEVSPALRADLVRFFARGDDQRFVGARFPRKVWFIDRWITHGDWYPDLSLRLFHRDRAHWGGDAVVHEKISADGPVARLRGDLHHYSFPTLASHVSKINAFAELFVRQRQDQGTRFSLFPVIVRPFWRFFRAYVIKLGFLDGFPGFYIASATAFSAFVRYSRLYEVDHAAPPPDAS